MAVSFEVHPSASAEVESNVSPVDLANGEPTEVEAVAAAATEAFTPAVESVPVVDPELLRKWEQDCNKASKQHAISIEQTKALMVELDKQISYKTDELKSIKDEKKGAVERLIRLEIRGPEMPPKPQPQKVAASSTTSSPAGDNAASESTDDSWREIPTVKILEGIERLGTKKFDAIADAFPTLGHLEDIRGEASKEHVHFAEKLPDGIGKTIADKIEERMMDEIAKYSVGLKVVSAPVDVEETDEITPDVEYEDADATPADEEDTLAGV